jgi:hypothetical protein
MPEAGTPWRLAPAPGCLPISRATGGLRSASTSGYLLERHRRSPARADQATGFGVRSGVLLIEPTTRQGSECDLGERGQIACRARELGRRHDGDPKRPAPRQPASTTRIKRDLPHGGRRTGEKEPAHFWPEPVRSSASEARLRRRASFCAGHLDPSPPAVPRASLCRTLPQPGETTSTDASTMALSS